MLTILNTYGNKRSCECCILAGVSSHLCLLNEELAAYPFDLGCSSDPES